MALDALESFDHPAWFAAVGTGVAYSVLLVVLFVLLFVVPYVALSSF